MKDKHRVAVIGSGFSGLSAAAYLGQRGYDVDILEKNAGIGGRARQLSTDNGYIFDMGPSWYWMPEVFENFFHDFGYKTSDFYQLQQLDPGFSIVFGKDDLLAVPADFDALCALFESLETGSSGRLKIFLKEAAYKYHTGMGKLVYMPGLSAAELVNWDLIKGLFRLQVFTPFSKHVRKFFSHPKLIALMEFPVLFLGAMPQDTPALYSLMNYAELRLGTWYPKGGFGKVIQGMQQVCKAQGVKIYPETAVTALQVKPGRVTAVVTKDGHKEYDAVIAAADYQHVESALLPAKYRNYAESYWNSRIMSPSCLIFYLGVTCKVDRLDHHTLFFDADLKQHAQEIYKDPKWPSRPLFYVCCPSKSDDSVAPGGHENLFVLMPLAPGLIDHYTMREEYFSVIMDRLENFTGILIRQHLDYKKSYCVNDFKTDYHAYKGNAYGLANTLMQTAHLKPSIKNNKLGNLFYAGQLTVPGPGVPPSIISGKVSALQLHNFINHHYESNI